MTLLLCESFDGVGGSVGTYLTSGKGWTSFNPNAAIAAGGRHGNCLDSVIGTNGCIIANYDIPAAGEHATMLVGLGFKASSFAANRNICTLYSHASSNLGIVIYVGTDGKVVVARRSTGNVLQSGGLNEATLVAGAWHWIEIKAVINGASSSVEVRVNGAAGIPGAVTSQIQDGGDAVWRRAVFNDNYPGASNPSANVLIDDVVIWNGAGSTNNDWMGDTAVECLRPVANGNASQWTGSDADSTDNYLHVDEVSINDSDYVQEETMDGKDTYGYTNRSATGVVRAVQHTLRALWIDAACQIRNVARLSGTEVESATKPLTNSHAHYTELWESKPGGGAWGTADVDAAEFGQVAKA